MPSVTPRFTLLGAILSAVLAPVAFAAPSLIVNQDTIGVQSPTSGPGVSYRAADASNAWLTAFTDGYLLCANVGSPPAGAPSTVHLAPRYEAGNQHQWIFPSVIDVFPLSYRNGIFSINRQDDGVRLSTLTCNALGPHGEWTNPLVGGIFADSFDVAGGRAALNYHHMINWDPPLPGPGPDFRWRNPDWAAVPQDPCVLGANDQGSMRVDEADVCAAATGVVAPDVVGISPRHAIMWVGVWQVGFTLNLTYLFRIDATLGAQTVNGGGVELPMTMSEAADVQSSSVSFSVRDAFDKTLLSDAGSWCMLAQLPAVLDEHTCDGAADVGTLSESDPFITKDFPLVILPPANSARASFYMAVTRALIGGQNEPAANTPIAEVSVFVEPSAVAAGGNQFRGDDVVFGFVPSSAGFRWMKGGPNNP